MPLAAQQLAVFSGRRGVLPQKQSKAAPALTAEHGRWQHRVHTAARSEQWGSFIEATFAIIYQLNTNMQHCIPVTNEAEVQVQS